MNIRQIFSKIFYSNRKPVFKTVYQIWRLDGFDYRNVDRDCIAAYTNREEAERILRECRQQVGPNSIIKFWMDEFKADVTLPEIRERLSRRIR